jgi:arylsulfatase A-like enzyme
MDIAPTILAATGTRASRKLDGMNLLPILQGKAGERARKAVREGDLKYVVDNGVEALHDLAKDPLEQHNLLPGDTRAAILKKKLAGWEGEVAAPRLREFPR